MKNKETLLFTNSNIPGVDPRTLALANKVGDLISSRDPDSKKKLGLININNALEFDVNDSLENLVKLYCKFRDPGDENFYISSKDNSQEAKNLQDTTGCPIIGEFSRWLLLSRNFSQHTVDNYIRTITKFDNFLLRKTQGERGVSNPELMTIFDVDGFIEELREEGISARTSNNKLSAVKTFLRFCGIKGQRANIDSKDFYYAKEDRKPIEALSEVECRQLIDYMKNDKSKNYLARLRDLCMVEVLLYTGVRVSELCNLRVDALREAVTIKGKGRKYRVVYLFQKHLNLLWELVLACKKKGINSEYVFVSFSGNSLGRQISRDSVERVVKDAGINAGIHSPVFPHKLRHTFATQLLKKGVDLMTIKELMGHSSILTTQTYLSLEKEDLKNAQANLQDFEIDPNDFSGLEYQTIAGVIKNRPNMFNLWKENSMNLIPGSEINVLSGI